MRIDRLLGIVTTLLQKDKVTAPYLAEKFEVSRRTINRDVDALCMAGIPVITYPGNNGGISIAKGYKLDKSILTPDDLEHMFAALKGLGSVSEDSQFEKILDKLSMKDSAMVSLKESIVIDLSSHDRDSLTRKITLLKEAIRNQQCVSFDYYYNKGQERRTIEPYYILFKWTSWYVLGYCLTKRDYRFFKLNRLWNESILNEAFTPREIPSDKMDMGTYFTDEKTITAIFDPSVKYILIESYGPNCYTTREDGSLFMKLEYTNREFILPWLLSFGDAVEVVEPEDIKIEIRRTAENILKK